MSKCDLMHRPLGTFEDALTKAALDMQAKESEAAGCMKGGVLTPATAMGLVLLQRLQSVGFNFEILDPGSPMPAK